MLSYDKKKKISEAFINGTLRVQSVSPEGQVEWKRVLHVVRTDIPWESIWEHRTEHGPMVLTGGHRVFLTPTTKSESEKLQIGDHVLAVCGGKSGKLSILEKRRLEGRKHCYDLTAEDWHNFVLHRSKIVVSNSPDKFYHFAPPEHEGRIGKFNRVFGQIWEDEELCCYLEMGLLLWNMYPPETSELCSIEQLAMMKPEWKMAIIWGAIVHAMFALALNWIVDEFSVVYTSLVEVNLPDGRVVTLEIGELYDIIYGGS